MVAFVTKRRETRGERGGLCLTEDEANYFFRQLIWAVQFCHRNHVAHRDLKLDNTILDHRSEAIEQSSNRVRGGRLTVQQPLQTAYPEPSDFSSRQDLNPGPCGSSA